MHGRGEMKGPSRGCTQRRSSIVISITWVSSSRAGWPVDEGELGAEDGGELERVMEAARLHLAVNGRQPPR